MEKETKLFILSHSVVLWLYLIRSVKEYFLWKCARNKLSYFRIFRSNFDLNWNRVFAQYHLGPCQHLEFSPKSTYTMQISERSGNYAKLEIFVKVCKRLDKPERSRVWVIFPSGILSERSQHCIDKCLAITWLASSRLLTSSRVNVSSISCSEPMSDQAMPKFALK